MHKKSLWKKKFRPIFGVLMGQAYNAATRHDSSHLNSTEIKGRYFPFSYHLRVKLENFVTDKR